MSDLETRLRTAMHEETAPLSAPQGLAGDMAARGARARRRRRVAGAAAALAVVAVAVPVIHGLTGSTTVGPVSPRPSVSRSPSRPATPLRSPSAWIAGLPDGNPPAVPYLRGMTYLWHPRPETTASYAVPDVNTNVFGPVDGGVMVGRVAARATFGIARPSGGFLMLGRGTAAGMAASPDGRRVAVGDSDAHRVQVYEARTGTRLASTRAVDARVLSWGPGGVYYETGVFSGHTTTWVWNPGSGNPPARTAAALDEHGVGLVTANSRCTRLATAHGVGDCLPLPRSASEMTVSPDGRYVGYVAGGRTMRVAVLDTATGASEPVSPELPYSAFDPAPGNLVWEPRDELLWVLCSHVHRHRATESLVRCSADTRSCAVAVRDVTGPTGGFYGPLSLTPPYIY